MKLEDNKNVLFCKESELAKEIMDGVRKINPMIPFFDEDGKDQILPMVIYENGCFILHIFMFMGDKKDGGYVTLIIHDFLNSEYNMMNFNHFKTLFNPIEIVAELMTQISEILHKINYHSDVFVESQKDFIGFKVFKKSKDAFSAN